MVAAGAALLPGKEQGGLLVGELLGIGPQLLAVFPVEKGILPRGRLVPLLQGEEIVLRIDLAGRRPDAALTAQRELIGLAAQSLDDSRPLAAQVTDQLLPEFVEVGLGAFGTQPLRRGAQGDPLEDPVMDLVANLGIGSLIQHRTDALHELLVAIGLVEGHELDLAACLVLAKQG